MLKLIVKLIILFVVIVLSFLIFYQLLDLPFKENKVWYYASRYLLVLFFVAVLFFFNDLSFSISAMREKMRRLRMRPFLQNTVVVSDLILNAIFITFFIFVGSAYFTMYRSKEPFQETAQVVKMKCRPAFGGKYSPLPSFTRIRFLSDGGEYFTLTFRDNICSEKPAVAERLPLKHVTLSGRQGFFGKFYDKIDL
jgi:hypothetical protein